MTDALYPLLLTPTLHIKVWGGRRLETELGKLLPGDSPYGESWELHDSATIGNGDHAGRDLSELISELGADLIGDGYNPEEGLPLLVKLLDANQWLSVQVHPNDQQAKELEGAPRGKTEAWVILETEDDAEIIIGLDTDTTEVEMADAIREETIEDLLEYATVTAGDVIYMPANTVHAIGPGILLYEVQQSSDVTYRLYDWGRTGLDGKPRELHIEKGVQVANLDDLPEIVAPEGEILVEGEFFHTKRIVVNDTTRDLTTAGVFHSITCVAGAVTIEHAGELLELELGRTAMIPAKLGAYKLSGAGTILLSHMV